METQDVNNQSLSAMLKNKAGLVIGGVAIFGFLMVGIWWLMRPSYEVLLQEIPEESRAEVLALLMQSQVPYEIEEGTGNVLVPSEHIAPLRTQLSAQGLPARHSVGLELFGQGDYGMSEFAQRINYQRALEGELARTIQSIDEVRYARVHITLGKSSIFENRKEPAKASIALQLKPDQRLSSQQVFGIQQLVAAAVPALAPDQVIVLDDMGRSLASNDGMGGSDRWSSVRQLEQDYEQRARLLISGLLPKADFQLSVKLQVNFDKVKSVKEDVIPAKGSHAGYLIKKREQASSGQSGNGQSVAGSQNNNNAESEYLFGRERAEIEHAVGKIERINVGIVASGSLSPQTIETIRTIIGSGLGLVTERGDSLAIVGAMPVSVVTEELAGNQATQVEPLTASPSEVETSLFTPGLYVAGALALIVLLAMAAIFARRPRYTAVAQRSLSLGEREQLLHDVRHWLTKDEVR